MVAGAIYSALPCGAARFQVPSRLMPPPEPSRMVQRRIVARHDADLRAGDGRFPGTLVERSHEAFFIGSPSFGDEQRSSRSDNWRGESERRTSATFGECGRAARRLYADR